MDDPVGLTVHSMPAPVVADDAARSRSGRLKMLGLLLACAAPVIASYFTYYVIRPQSTTNYGELIDAQVGLPDAHALPLADLQGSPVDPATLKDQWLLVVVGGGACDARCEHLLWLQRQLREALGRDRERVDRVWLVSDEAPVRPALLPAMKGATVLRAPRASIEAWLKPGAGHALEDHFYLVDPLGRWMMRMPAEPDAKKVKRDLDRLLRASASWDTEGRSGLRPQLP